MPFYIVTKWRKDLEEWVIFGFGCTTLGEVQRLIEQYEVLFPEDEFRPAQFFTDDMTIETEHEYVLRSTYEENE